MQPVRMEMSGFLSYREREIIDFTQFEVACITGENGAGKSSILDAMTFALFGKARVNHGSSLINISADQASVVFDFIYNGITYRIIRNLFRKTKPTEVYFSYFDPSKEKFVPVSSNSKNKTDEVIRNSLNLDYETFTTASFFLQGQADSFAKSNPAERKKILSKILRLDRWSEYQDRTKDIKKEYSSELNQLRLTIARLNDEINEENTLISSREEYTLKLGELDIEENGFLENINAIEKILNSFEAIKTEIQQKEQAVQQKSEEIIQKENYLSEKNKQLAAVLSLVDRKSEILFLYDDLKKKKDFLSDQRVYHQKVEKLTSELESVTKMIDYKTSELKTKIFNLEKEQESLNDQLVQIPELNNTLKELQKNQKQIEDLELDRTNLEQTLNMMDEFFAIYQNWSEKNQAIESDRSQINLKIGQLNKEKNDYSIVEQEIISLKNNLIERQNELSKLEQRRILIDENLLKIAELDRAIDKIDHQLSQNNERLSHLSHEHSHNCPTCERALTPIEKLGLEEKLEREINDQRLQIESLSVRRRELEPSNLSDDHNDNSISTVQTKIQTIKLEIARLETLIQSAENMKKLWTAEKEDELAQLNSSLSTDNSSLRELSKLQSSLESYFYNIVSEKSLSNPQVAYKQIKSEKENKQILRDQTIKKIHGMKNIPSMIAEIRSRIKALEEKKFNWTNGNERLLKQFTDDLNNSTTITDEIDKSAEIQRQLKAIPYDPEKVKIFTELIASKEKEIEDEYIALKNAGPREIELKSDIHGLTSSLENLKNDQIEIRREINKKIDTLANEKEITAERNRILDQIESLRDRIISINQQIGEIKQKLKVIESAKNSIVKSNIDIERLEKTLINLEVLDKAFGKNGIPAMLIEQAKPDLESEANRILAKLTDGFSIRIHTQKEYKDQRRQEQMETLEIEISDGSGSREYETYSGGESFRVNFAIRLSLSRLLAHRADAKLETLVIDEGFGSQDDDGKQRLIEAIRAVQPDFKKILVITHLDELKEKFDHRIEVQKIEHTSRIRVI